MHQQGPPHTSLNAQANTLMNKLICRETSKVRLELGPFSRPVGVAEIEMRITATVSCAIVPFLKGKQCCNNPHLADK